MKKLLNTPARVVIAVGLIILLGEFLIMLLIESIHTTILKDVVLEKIVFEFIDPLLLIAIVSPALYILILQPMSKQQAELDVLHKKVESAFQEWIAALDAVNDPIFLHDQDFRILRCNKAYQQCAGIPFHEIIGQPYYTIFPKDHAPLPSCQRAMEKAEEEEVAAGGAIYRSRAFSIHDEQGAYLYSVHILEDITEHKQADVQIRLFRELLDHTSDSIFIVDPATSRFLDVNEAACRSLRYARDELLQRGVVDIQTTIIDSAAWQAHSQELRAQSHASLEFDALRKDGSRFPVEASLQYVTVANQAYIIAVVRDITERKHAEEQAKQLQEYLQLQFDRMPIGCITWDTGFCVQSWNPAAEKLFGFTAAEALGKHPYDLIVPKEAQPQVDDIWHRLLEGDTTAHSVNENTTKNGRTIICQWSNTPLKKVDGTVAGVLSMVQDITERKHHDELAAALLKLYASAETLDENTLLQRGLDTVQRLTGSRIGFLHFVSEDQNEIGLVTWSTDTLAHYCQAAFDRHYPVSAAGIWADCIRLKQPVIINDYAAASGKKALPEGHADLQRFISVPVFEGTQVRMIIGVGNAARDYGEHDAEMAKLFGYGLYRIVQRKRTEEVLRDSEEQYRTMIENSNDMIWTLAPDGRFTFINQQAADVTGRSIQDWLGKTFEPLVMEEDLPRVLDIHGKIMSGEKVHYEVRGKKADGGVLTLSVNASPIFKDGKVSGTISFASDITARKQMEKELRESEARYRRITEGITDYQYTVHIENGRAMETTHSPACVTVTGYTAEEFAANPNLWIQMVVPEDRDRVREHVRQILAGQNILFVEHRITRKDGEIRWICDTTILFKDATGKLLSYDGVIRDITERKKAEETLLENAVRFRVALENSPIVVFNQDRELRYTWIYNPHPEFDQQTVLGKTDAELLPADDAAVLTEIKRRVLETGFTAREQVQTTIGGQAFFYDLTVEPLRDQSGNITGVTCATMDITERKRAEAVLKEREEKFRSIFEEALDGILLADAETKQFVTANPEICRMLGYRPEEITRLGVTDIHPQQDLPYIQGQFEKLARGEIKVVQNLPMRHKDGSIFYADVKGAPVSFGGKNYLLGIFRDTTERKRAEAEIKHANRALATLGAVNSTLVHATDENELMQAICQAIVEQKGYRMAWVGYKQQDEGKSIQIIARAGQDKGYLDALQLTWSETERGMGPAGRSIRSGATQVCQDIASDPLFLPWRDAALERGYAASIALPLTYRNGKVFGTLAVYSNEVNAFSTAEIALLEEMAGDLAFGVHSLHVREERDLALAKNQEQMVQLQDSLEDTVRAIATIVEMRDPYTAGHQARVADLALAIARQLGLPEEQVHAIHLAGVVHDLGKIKIPAEILSKPGRINEIEFSLIKVHPQAGYDILKGINFPWPIAQMVLQHHERLDGSGYPQGIKGDAILLEARILSVADVVEAICSHRPYRAGLGIEVALAEITKQRGVYYDSRVVEACLAVFREQGYNFKS